MRADAHARARAVAVMRGAAGGGSVVDGVVGQVAVRVEGVGVLEVRVVVVRRVGVHVERCARGDRRAFPRDGLRAGARQTDGDHGPEAQGFFDEGRDVRAGFFLQAAFPAVAVGVFLLDLREGSALDFLPVLGREVRDAHDEITRDGVQTRRDHGETDGHDFGCVGRRFG